MGKNLRRHCWPKVQADISDLLSNDLIDYRGQKLVKGDSSTVQIAALKALFNRVITRWLQEQASSRELDWCHCSHAYAHRRLALIIRVVLDVLKTQS